MPNIFKQAQQVNDHPKRNNFDLSKKINASFKFGTLYPVYCQPVVPGDSFSIDTAFNIKAMPVVFPVQTKMRAHMHYFYVRNKNLWKNWENWLSNLPNATQDLTPHPYVSRPDVEFANGSIHDFLGVPTSLVTGGTPVEFPSGYIVGSSYVNSDVVFGESYSGVYPSSYSFLNSYGVIDLANEPEDITSAIFSGNYSSLVIKFPSTLLAAYPPVSNDTPVYIRPVVLKFGEVIERHYFNKPYNIGNWIDLTNLSSGSFHMPSGDYLDFVKYIKDNFVEGEFVVTFEIFIRASAAAGSSSYGYGVEFDFNSEKGFVEYSQLNVSLYSQHLHINVLPYRAYESIYNAYYRNTVVDPLKVDDQVLYNKFIPNDGDGADTYHYQLHQRNYELDFLTSALPSPQQGVAPMVGVTALGDITIEDENGITTARTESDEAGYVTKVVLTSPAASNDHARLLMNIAASGFNINDFRNTNALQRFLETSIRKGYKYKDFIAGHFGVEPKYVELDMPEFIGGFSRDVAVSTVVSNADTLGDNSGAALGEFGGFAQVVGGSRHSVRHYCDDYGFIMGILCITPTPCYSQLLPKHMVAPDNFLDYYFAEFSNIGMQPITYKEVVPIQSYLDSLLDPDKHLEDTFGYQRPNYDMVAAVDEVHGDFRGSLRNYVINRIFDHRPELGHDFITIRPDEVNDIFVDTDPRDDTFIGEVGFSVHAKRPVPRVVIPNLGR